MFFVNLAGTFDVFLLSDKLFIPHATSLFLPQVAPNLCVAATTHDSIGWGIHQGYAH